MKIIYLVIALVLAFSFTGCSKAPDNTGTVAEPTLTAAPAEDAEIAKAGDVVRVNYTGKFVDGEIFDTSIGREPLEFEVGAGEMISGFDKAVEGMKVGESKTVELPPEEAYGDRQVGSIPPNSTLIFEIELVEIVTP